MAGGVVAQEGSSTSSGVTFLDADPPPGTFPVGAKFPVNRNKQSRYNRGFPKQCGFQTEQFSKLCIVVPPSLPESALYYWVYEIDNGRHLITPPGEEKVWFHPGLAATLVPRAQPNGAYLKWVRGGVNAHRLRKIPSACGVDKQSGDMFEVFMKPERPTDLTKPLYVERPYSDYFNDYCLETGFRERFRFVRDGTFYKKPSRSQPPVDYFAGGEEVRSERRWGDQWLRTADRRWFHISDVLPTSGFHHFATTTSNLRVRSSPNPDAEALHLLETGSRIVLYESNGWWYRVTPNQHRPAGWVFAQGNVAVLYPKTNDKQVLDQYAAAERTHLAALRPTPRKPQETTQQRKAAAPRKKGSEPTSGGLGGLTCFTVLLLAASCALVAWLARVYFPDFEAGAIVGPAAWLVAVLMAGGLLTIYGAIVLMLVPFGVVVVAYVGANEAVKDYRRRRLMGYLDDEDQDSPKVEIVRKGEDQPVLDRELDEAVVKTNPITAPLVHRKIRAQTKTLAEQADYLRTGIERDRLLAEARNLNATLPKEQQLREEELDLQSLRNKVEKLKLEQEANAIKSQTHLEGQGKERRKPRSPEEEIARVVEKIESHTVTADKERKSFEQRLRDRGIGENEIRRYMAMFDAQVERIGRKL